jgi:small subunit ribosomal protein S1
MATATMEDFEALLQESFELHMPEEGSVVRGKVLSVDNGQALIDIGFKMEGRVDLKEFQRPGEPQELHAGDTVEVYLDRVENAKGEAVLSRDKARREEAWDRLEAAASEKEARVEGQIFGRVKGGFTVDLGGAVAFLPGSQVDVRPVRDITPLLGVPQPFQILKMDRRRGNIVVSRRAVLEESRAEQRAEVVARLTEGDTVEGVVKNITDYGAFVELEPGVEGLVHVSEMSWTKKNVHPGKIVSTSQEVEVMVLDVDPVKRRVSLGLKQCLRNPWELFAESHPPGTQVEGEVKNITEFGLFIGLEGDIDGMVHLSDLDWDRPGEQVLAEYQKGDMVQAVVLDVDVEKERISLGVKQLQEDSFTQNTAGVKRGDIVTVAVTKIEDGGIEVEYEGAKSFIRRSDLARDRQDQRPERFSVGDKLDARVTNIDKNSRRLGLSIKAREIAEEREAVEQFGSSDSGASLGDILGAALQSQDTTEEK